MENEKIIELMGGLTAEELSSIFFDKEALTVQPEPMFRLSHNGERFYYNYNEDGAPVVYTSVTTFIKATLPTSEHLINWKADLGKDAAEAYMNERAAYGTFMHMQFEKFLINGSYDLDGLELELGQYMQNEGLAPSFMKHAYELKKDMLAFAKWVQLYDVKPLAIEIILAHPDGYAGAIDLVCELELGEKYKSGAKKGQLKGESIRGRAIVDFKSGRKSFYESSEIQLGAYREAWNHNFPDKPITKLFNWSPKEWRSAPDFNFKDQTNAKSLAKLPALVQLAAIENEKRDYSIRVIEGTINFNDSPEDCFKSMPLMQVLDDSMKPVNAIRPKPLSDEQRAEVEEVLDAVDVPDVPVQEEDFFKVSSTGVGLTEEGKKEALKKINEVKDSPKVNLPEMPTQEEFDFENPPL